MYEGNTWVPPQAAPPQGPPPQPKPRKSRTVPILAAGALVVAAAILASIFLIKPDLQAGTAMVDPVASSAAASSAAASSAAASSAAASASTSRSAATPPPQADPKPGRIVSDMYFHEDLGAQWDLVIDKPGEYTFQHGDTPCFVYIAQPADLYDEASIPTDSQIAKKYLLRIAKTFSSSDPVVSEDFQRMFGVAEEPAAPGISKVTFTGVNVQYNEDTQGQVLAYRNGAYALIVGITCGGGQWAAQNDALMQPALDQLTVKLYL
ncbi:hypothetical protein [Nakamurella antarctica]|uniref:hypothetical protein n=1 Tax=Nakamurella antarctica TaxID=1902245 RepID=UPI0019D26BD6|nr:hypothetical protein [Nakamurella antarctica]